MIFLNVKGTEGSLLIPPLFGSDKQSFSYVLRPLLKIKDLIKKGGV